MTEQEARELLKDMSKAKRRANAIKARIADIESDAASIQSALGGDGTHGGAMRSRVEELAIKIETEREKHMAALEEYFALEDKLAAAIDTLDPMERDIIVGHYMDGKMDWQVWNDVGYERRNYYYVKKRAIEKISEKI